MKRLFWRCFTGAYLIQAMLAVGFLFPIILASRGYSIGAIGWSMSALNLAAILSRPIGGWATERWGFSGALLLAGVLSVVSTGFIWAVPGLSGMISFRVGLGMVGGIAMVAISTFQGLVIPESQRGPLFAILGIAYVLPQITVVPLGEWLLNQNLEIAYLLLPAILTVTATLAGRGLPSPESLRQDQDRDDWGGWGDCIKTSGIWAMVLTLASFSILNSTTLQFLSLPVREKGLPASLFYTVNAVTCIVLRVFGGQFIKNIPRYLLGCVSIMIMAVALTGALEANTSLTLTLSAVGYGCGMGFGFPVMLALIPDVFPPRLMPKGSSIGMLSMDLGFALSPLIIGALSVYLGTPGAMRAIAWGQLVIAPTALILWKISIKRKLSFDKKEESECLIR